MGETAILHVTKVIYGGLQRGARVPVSSFFYYGGPHYDLALIPGEHIFFFNLKNGQAESSPWFNYLSPSRYDEVEIAAASNPVRIRSRPTATKPFQVAIGYQNCSTATMVLPGISTLNGKLVLPPDALLEYGTFYEGSTISVLLKGKPGPAASDETSVTLLPMHSWYKAVNLADIDPGIQEGMRVRWSVPGLGRSNSISLYPLPAKTGKLTADELGMEPVPLLVELWACARYPSPLTLRIEAGLVLFGILGFMLLVDWFKRRVRGTKSI